MPNEMPTQAEINEMAKQEADKVFKEEMERRRAERAKKEAEKLKPKPKPKPIQAVTAADLGLRDDELTDKHRQRIADATKHKEEAERRRNIKALAAEELVREGHISDVSEVEEMSAEEVMELAGFKKSKEEAEAEELAEAMKQPDPEAELRVEIDKAINGWTNVTNKAGLNRAIENWNFIDRKEAARQLGLRDDQVQLINDIKQHEYSATNKPWQ